MRTPDTFIASQGSQHRDGLNGLTQTHFICQYSIELSVMQSDHPVHPNDLVFTKRPFQYKWNLCRHLSIFKSVAHWLESLSYFHCFFGQTLLAVSILIVFGLFVLLYRFWSSFVVHWFDSGLDLLLLLNSRFIYSIFFSVFTLLDELFGVQRLCHFHTELQMLGDKILKLLSPHLLPFTFIFNVIIVFDNLLARFPV